MVLLTVKGTQVHIGDTLQVKTMVEEGGKSRVQSFRGVLIALGGRDEDKIMTIRRIANRGIGVERKWPVHAKTLVSVSVIKSAKKVRRSKLYYLRNLTGRAASQI